MAPDEGVPRPEGRGGERWRAEPFNGYRGKFEELILERTDDVKRSVEMLDAKLDERLVKLDSEITQLKVDVAGLKVKAAIIAFVAGSATAALIQLLVRMFASS